ncbi:septum formation initiator family protein [Wohlfahrtiimonas sp. G9077]|uniref:FtsB family cell division protein n=1 Tax=Wohlfahrtiimonas sp. G9077 TaxID=1980118 RepID=UPI000B99D552|nr:septum formation initiator family protein [Wohlfahrtiimonas sp. G9077]OYQ75204.1 cell division protein FtsB [Wohlfahrtiimonas sp. G9077]
MKWLHALIAFLAGLVFYLSYNLWFQEDQGYASLEKLAAQIETVNQQNKLLEARNTALEVKIKSLKTDVQAQEELARHKLGLIQEDETFYQILPSEEEHRHYD